jgi:mannose-6-phosphate isomerase-like protein (cupin superfamily)
MPCGDLHDPPRGLEFERVAATIYFEGKKHIDGTCVKNLTSEVRNRGDIEMAETTAYPYATHLDIKFDPLALIDVSALAKTVTDQWYNQTLCKVNDSVVRLGVMQGEYHWHKHDHDDEFFFVLSGRFIIDLEGSSVELLPNQGFTVPKGVLHCTRAPEKSVILMVETAAIVPTGDT